MMCNCPCSCSVHEAEFFDVSVDDSNKSSHPLRCSVPFPTLHVNIPSGSAVESRAAPPPLHDVRTCVGARVKFS